VAQLFSLGGIRTMKSIIVLLLSCICLLAEDDIGITTTIKTNAVFGEVVTTKYFSRGGQTNLLCRTTMTNGVIHTRSYRFYHDGKLAADYLCSTRTGYSQTVTHNGFDATFICDSSNILDSVYIFDKDRQNVLDGFEATNGMLTPIPTSELSNLGSIPDVVKPETNNQTTK
jgi:hypothetical protein